MNSEKPHFLNQPVVKNIFVYRNGDPYYEARRLVVNQKRMSNFETFLREVTGGVQPPFGAVRNIYTPKAGHRVASLEHLQSGEQYVAAGREKFKKLDYSQIASKKKRMLQTISGQAKPVPQSRIIVSARFLKPIKEPCAIFVVANGDVLNPAVRLLIPQRMLGQFDRVLEMITEKMGLRILGGVRSLYSFDGHLISDGKELESGQFYVAVGRDKLKRLPYSDLIFTKPRGIRRITGSKAASLPPIYRFGKQNGHLTIPQSKSMVRCSDAVESQASSSGQGKKEHLSSIVREISQARLMTLRKKRSGLSMSLGTQDNDEGEQTTEEVSGEKEDKSPQDDISKPDPPTEEKQTEDGENTNPEKNPEDKGEKEETPMVENTTEDVSGTGEESQEPHKPSKEHEDTSPGAIVNGEVEEGEEAAGTRNPDKNEESEKAKDDLPPSNDGKKEEDQDSGNQEKDKDSVNEEKDKDSVNEEKDKDSVNEENDKDSEGSKEQAGTSSVEKPDEKEACHESGTQADPKTGEGGNEKEKTTEATEGDAEVTGEDKEVNGEQSGDEDDEEEEEENAAITKDAKTDESTVEEGEAEERHTGKESDASKRGEAETERANSANGTNEKKNVEEKS